MSNEKVSRQELPSLEPWLRVGLLAFAPLAAAFTVPSPHTWYLLVAAVGLTALSIAMLIRQERQKGGDR